MSDPPPAEAAEDQDEAPNEEAPEEDAPKEEAPKEEAPKDEAPKEEAPKEEAPKDGTAPEDADPDLALGRDPFHGGTAYFLAALSGVLYALGLPGLDIWPLALVAQVPLLLALRGQPTKRAAGLGWVAGFFMCAVGFYWLRGMLAVFSKMPMPVPALLMAVLCAYQGARMALCGALYGRATRKGWPAVPVFAAAFVTSELVFPLLFPWYFGNSVHNALPLAQVAEFGGPYLVGLVLLCANFLVYAIAEKLLFAQTPSKVVLGVGVAVPLLAAGWGFVRIGQIEEQQAAAKGLKVAMVQANQPLMKHKDALKRHWRLSEEAKKSSPDLVVWSEGAVRINVKTDDYAAEVKQRIARQIGAPAVLGLVIRKKLPPGGPFKRKVATSAVSTTAEGDVTGRYDKTYLLMFGEYLPFGDVFPALYKVSPNSSHLTPGTSLAPLKLGERKLSTSICYEDILPRFINAMMRVEDPDLMVNLTNDAWFGDTLEPRQHLALATMRSIEQRRYLVRSTNSGISAIVDATGKIILEGNSFTEEVIVGEAKYLTSGTVYRSIGDIPWYLVAVALLAMCFVSRPGHQAMPSPSGLGRS